MKMRSSKIRDALSLRGSGRRVCGSLLAAAIAAAPLVTGVSYAGEPPRAGATGDVSAEVGRLFDAAEAAFARKDYQASYEAYRAAWALQRSYDIAGNLGNVEIELGKVRDAAEHLSFALRNFPPTGQPKQRAMLMRRIDGVLPLVGRVRVQVNVEGATVLLNGVAVGTSPIAEVVFVDPGVSTLEAKREGYQDARATVKLAPAENQKVTLTLAPAPREAGGAVGPSGPTGPKGGGRPQGPVGPIEDAVPAQRSLVPAFVIGGVGGVALVGGLVLIGVAESKRSDAEALSAETGHACPVDATSPKGKCADLADAASSADTFGNVGIGGLAIAGAAAAGVAAYLLWPAPSDKPAGGSVRAAPVVGLRGGGVVVAGSF
jgi:hypothetical protein